MDPNEKTRQRANMEVGFFGGKSDLPSLQIHDPSQALQQIGEWFRLDVANGDARPDTINTYMGQVSQWFDWCRDNNIHPGHATRDDIKAYRQFLVSCEAKHATITLKLTTVRRFYEAAVERGLIAANPAAEVRAPRNRDASETLKYLSAGEAELLFRAIPRDNSLKASRDRALVALMVLEGLRRVEIQRASVTDIEHAENAAEFRILIHGKGKDAYIYPRPDTLALIQKYLAARGPILPDTNGEPLFVAITKGGKPRGRLSRIGINSIIDSYLNKSRTKREGISCHALRHTCGHLLYQSTRDVKVIQETLRHANIATAAKYSHVEEKKKARYSSRISIKTGEE